MKCILLSNSTYYVDFFFFNITDAMSFLCHIFISILCMIFIEQNSGASIHGASLRYLFDIAFKRYISKLEF